MALTQQMMLILINEYFTDPKNLGYRKYGRMDGIKFYVPQILQLLNTARDRTIYKSKDSGSILSNQEDILASQNYYTKISRSHDVPRVCEIFSGIPGAPNALTEADILQTLSLFSELNPTMELPTIVTE